MQNCVLILIERKNKKQFSRFIELFKTRSEIPIREIRSMVSKSTFYNFVIDKLCNINQSIKHINPGIENFIAPAFNNDNGRVIQTFKRNCNIEIIDEDPNYFYLRLSEGAENGKIY